MSRPYFLTRPHDKFGLETRLVGPENGCRVASHSQVWLNNCSYYPVHTGRGNVFGRVCLSLFLYFCLSVCMSVSTKKCQFSRLGHSIGAEYLWSVQNIERLPCLCFFCLKSCVLSWHHCHAYLGVWHFWWHQWAICESFLCEIIFPQIFLPRKFPTIWFSLKTYYVTQWMSWHQNDIIHLVMLDENMCHYFL